MTDWRPKVYSRPADAGLPRSWASTRRKVIRRDQQRCQRCRRFLAYKFATVHHITPRSENGDDRLDNLIALCSPCHDWVECAKPPLRSRASIQGSWGSSVDTYEIGEKWHRPDWHAVVYGGQRAA